jgi:hypothetical protein
MARSKPTDASAASGKAGRTPKATGATAASAKPATDKAIPKTAAKADPKASGKSTAKPGKAGKLDKNGQPKVGRIKKFGAQLKMIKQAYSLTRKNDPKLPWVMLIWFVAVAGVIELAGILFNSPFLFLPLAIVSGGLAALIIFGRRAQGSAYRQVEGQPGAAAWVLEGMRGDWRVTSGVAGTPQMDAVHRVLGRPGIILVGEGAPGRVRGLLAQEKKKVARVVGDTPIYDIVVGDDEGQIPLRRLSAHVMKLPRNLNPAELNSLGRRMSALGGPRMPVPGGPLPGGKQMSVSQRQVRRR